MKKCIAFWVLVVLALTTGLAMADGSALNSNFAPHPSSTAYLAINDVLTGDWQQYGQTFTLFASTLLQRMFLLILVIVPTIFFLHYILIGAKHFDHDGPKILFFGVLSRIVHWVAAIAFSILVITGLMIIFGKFIGGGPLVMGGIRVHIGAAMIFAVAALVMLLIWFIDMLPAWYDILWMFILGGYLSKKKKPVPAGKFNAGQKSWFWFATVGGGVMAYSGLKLFLFEAPTDELRLLAIIHACLGAVLIILFITHLYMVLFAIKGSIRSMINGYKPKEEVDIMHSRWKYE